jgi:predicted GIY-YIG superfamily endonuclease
VYRRFNKKVAAVKEKKSMKKKVKSPKLALPDSDAKIKWDLVNTKKAD